MFLSHSLYLYVFLLKHTKTFSSYSKAVLPTFGRFPMIFRNLHFTANAELNLMCFGYALTIYSRNIAIRFVYIKFLAWFQRTIVEEREGQSGMREKYPEVYVLDAKRMSRVWKKYVISNSNSIQLATTSYCHTCNAYRISTILINSSFGWAISFSQLLYTLLRP